MFDNTCVGLMEQFVTRVNFRNWTKQNTSFSLFLSFVLGECLGGGGGNVLVAIVELDFCIVTDQMDLFWFRFNNVSVYWHVLTAVFFRCFVWHSSFGATAVSLSWIGLVLFMRKFPKLGIYVVMFTDIFKTFAQFFAVCFLFIVAFGLGFHILLFNQVSM